MLLWSSGGVAERKQSCGAAIKTAVFAPHVLWGLEPAGQATRSSAREHIKSGSPTLRRMHHQYPDCPGCLSIIRKLSKLTGFEEIYLF
jgi:hypothetical protein